jgi:hypothetical protein
VLSLSECMKQSDPRRPESEDPSLEVSLKILRYLEKNPNAADTVDGVLEWWLPKQSIVEQEAVVRRALDLLVQRKLLLTKQLSDSRTHYRLNKDCMEEIRQLIDEMNSQEGK